MSPAASSLEFFFFAPKIVKVSIGLTIAVGSLHQPIATIRRNGFFGFMTLIGILQGGRVRFGFGVAAGFGVEEVGETELKRELELVRVGVVHTSRYIPTVMSGMSGFT